MTTNVFLHISAYCFQDFSQDLQQAKQQFQQLCRRYALRGTVLLSPEGANCQVVGSEPSIRAYQTYFQEFCGEPRLRFHESWLSYPPYRRMLVKVKKQLLPLSVAVSSEQGCKGRIAASTLRQWLDEKRNFLLLDMRNSYEVRIGAFKGTVDLGLQHFAELPEKIRQLPEETKQQAVVMYCTGGIRCEKAAPFLVSQGFSEVYQLDGGILGYFREQGSKHYHGDCYVFDQRVAVTTALVPSNVAECKVCGQPLRDHEQRNPLFQPGKHCPFCYSRARGVPSAQVVSSSEFC